MTLLDDLQTARKDARDARWCRVGLWLSQQDPEAQKEFGAYVDDRQIGGLSRLLQVCRENGLECSKTTFTDHCGGRCVCAPKKDTP